MILFLLSFIFWIVLNANITTEIVILGLVISGGVTFFTYKITILNIAVEKKIFKKIFRIIEYLIILVFEVYKANIKMIKIILNSDIDKLEPTLQHIKIDLKSNISRVALANSITLTPGTVTVTLLDDAYIIHGLDKSMLDGIDESIFVQKLREQEE